MSDKKRIYTVPVRYVFRGEFKIQAASKAQAEEYAEKHCWHKIQSDKSGFATDEALDEIFRELPRLVKDKRDGCIELIDYDNAAEWRGDLERKPSLYQWRPIHEIEQMT